MLQGDQIRVLDLLPSDGEDDSTIQGSTCIVSLADELEYETLSYRWGDPNMTENILISGQTVPITVTLHAALQRLRLPNETRRIWIDQICIAQDDNTEKINQVRLMRRIYQSCSRCIIWFGEIEQYIKIEDAEAAIELLKHLSEPENVVDPVALRSDTDYANTMKAMENISAFSQAWWQRVWTLQEAVLPTHKLIVWGHLTVSWDCLSHILTRPGWLTYECAVRRDALEKALPPDVPFVDHLYQVLLHVLWTNEMRLSYPHTLLRSIMLWRQKRDATDPRDKVLGYMGLAPENSLPNVAVCNYETPVANLYGAATLDLIAVNGLLSLLMNPHGEKQSRTPKVPSWAFDLKAQFRYTTDDWYSFWGWWGFNDCSDRELDMDWLKEMTNASGGRYNILGLRGAAVDKVKVISDERMMWHWPMVLTQDTVFSTMRQWLEFAQTHIKTPEIDVRVLFGRTVQQGLMRNVELQAERLLTEKDAREAVTAVESGTLNYDIWNDLKHLHTPIHNRTFFITEGGRLGLGHLETKIGDEVWIVDGGRVPLMLRKQDGGNDYEFVACCYVEGVMFGEVFDGVEMEGKTERIRIY